MDEVLARQFVAATNQMYDSLTVYETDQSLWRQESDGSLVRCATTGCSLLRNAAYMQALVDDVWALNESAAEYREDLQVITAVDHFEFFLGAEERLLAAAGADSSLATEILQQCREAREAARRGTFNVFTYLRFRDSLEELRNAVCDVLSELRYATFDPRRPPRRRYRRLAACFKGICGCVVVGLDASALAGTIGLSAAGSAVSIAVGAAVVDHALSDLRAAAPQRPNPPAALA